MTVPAFRLKVYRRDWVVDPLWDCHECPSWTPHLLSVPSTVAPFRLNVSVRRLEIDPLAVPPFRLTASAPLAKVEGGG
jgi:hypothetical protein